MSDVLGARCERYKDGEVTNTITACNGVAGHSDHFSGLLLYSSCSCSCSKILRFHPGQGQYSGERV
ncbi:MAG: hypothetical protein V2A73_09560 [Pseudomonadota bacterium]